MDEGRKTLASMTCPGYARSDNTTNLNKEKENALGDIWGTTRNACQERIAEYVMNEEGDSFTAEEHEIGIEKVRTGLQRSFDDEYEDEDDEMEDDEVDGVLTGGNAEPDLMIIDRPPPPPAPAVSTQDVDGATLETIMRLATRGRLTG